METNYPLDGNTILPCVNKPLLQTFFNKEAKLRCQKQMFKQMRPKQIRLISEARLGKLVS
jgi:hypothetical protein